VHIYVLGPKLLQWNFLQISQLIYTKWCAQTFPPIFGLFVIINGNFAKIAAPSGDINENHVVHLTEQSLLKKNRWKCHQNRPINRHTILVWSMYPTCRQTKRDIKKHQFSLLQSPRQTLHAVRERRDNSKRWQSFFDLTHSFSCRGENADFWSLTHWVNLIPSGCHGNPLVTTDKCRVNNPPWQTW